MPRGPGPGRGEPRRPSRGGGTGPAGPAPLRRLRRRGRRQVDPHRPAAPRRGPRPRRPARGRRRGQPQVRHPGRCARPRAPAGRPAGRTRAAHHHRRRLPLLRDRAPPVHRGRRARSRAVHPEHGDRRLYRGGRRRPRRRPPGGRGPDAPPHLHRLPARHPPPHPRGQQDGPRGLGPGALRGDRGRLARLRPPARDRRRRLHPDLGPDRRQRPRDERRDALVPGAGPAGAAGDARGLDRPRRGPLPHAGPVGEPARPGLPRLLRHHRVGDGAPGRPGGRLARRSASPPSSGSSPATRTSTRRSPANR